MDFSLEQFIHTGHLGVIQPGMLQEDITALLGPPHDTGGTSRKYKRPIIYVYGSFELFFNRHTPIECIGISWYAHRGAVSPTTENAMPDWERLLGMSRQELESYLEEMGFHTELVSAPSVTLTVPSGVIFVFHENGLLYSVSIWR